MARDKSALNTEDVDAALSLLLEIVLAAEDCLAARVSLISSLEKSFALQSGQDEASRPAATNQYSSQSDVIARIAASVRIHADKMGRGAVDTTARLPVEDQLDNPMEAFLRHPRGLPRHTRQRPIFRSHFHYSQAWESLVASEQEMRVLGYALFRAQH